MVVGTDLSWGAGDMMASALKIAPTELEDDRVLSMEAPEEQRQAHARQQMGKMMVACQELRNSELFRTLDIG